MPRLRGLPVALCLLLATACGQVEPVMVGARMPDCAQIGADTMRAGEARVVLALDGLADVGLYLVRIEGGLGVDELVGHIDQSGRLPSWSEVVVELRIDDAQGVDGTEREVSLGAGTYAVVCVDHAYGAETRLTVAGPVNVRR